MSDLDFSRPYLIGGAVSDVQAGLAVGCQVAKALTGRGHQQVQRLASYERARMHVAADLTAAVGWILAGEMGGGT